jgi:predicted transcriptional regulator
MYKANVNCNVLKNYLALLIKQGLVEERSILGERAVFVVTEHGIIVLNNFRNLTQALPDLECIQSQN